MKECKRIIGVAMSLLDFQPTEDEMAKAREVLGLLDRKGRLSKNTAMMQFVKANDPENLAKISASSKAERAAYVEKYLALQLAKSKGRLQQTTIWVTSDR